jgi:hypothetical protein
MQSIKKYLDNIVQSNIQLLNVNYQIREYKIMNLFRQILLIMIAAILVGESYLTTLHLGMDHSLPRHSYARAKMSIGISISKLTYGANGYVLYKDVINSLIDNGFNDDQITKTGQINHAINETKLLHISGENITIQPDWGDDKGYSDFTTLAFSLFGLNIEALLDLYFLIFIISILLFVINFVKDSQALFILIVFLVAQLLVINILPNTQVTSVVHDSRFLPVISFVAMIHWLISIARPFRKTALDVVLLIGQLVILIFVLNSRSSSIWQILAIGVVILYTLLRSYQQRNRWQSLKLLSAFLILASGVVFLNIYKNTTYDNIYTVANGTKNHAVWHNIYMGLGFHPEALSKYQLIPDDASVYKHTLNYLNTSPAALDRLQIKNTELYEPIFIPLGWGGYDKAVKEMFYDFIYRDPQYAAQSLFFYKPLFLFEQLMWQAGFLKEYPTWIEFNPVHKPSANLRLNFFNLIALLSFLSIVLINSKKIIQKKSLPYYYVVAISAIFSMIPSIVVGPFYYDLPVVFISFLMVFIIFIAIILSALICYGENQYKQIEVNRKKTLS